MKTHLNKSIALWAAIGVFLSGVALAQVTDSRESTGFAPHSKSGFGNHPPRHPGHLLSRAILENVALEVLTGNFGLDAATVKADMQTLGMREVLESYGIDGKTFRSRMDAKMTELVDKAASCGLITSEQASEIVEAIQNRPQRQSEPVTGGQNG